MSEPAPSAPETLPTGEPVPAAAPSPYPAEKPPAPAKTANNNNNNNPRHQLAALLRALPANTDAFLAHLQRCLATPAGIDTTLLFTCYASRFSGALLAHLSRRSPRSLVALALALAPKKTAALILTTTAPAAPARLAARLAALGSLASEARTIARLWGLLGMYFWARRLVLDLLSPSGGRLGAAALVDWVQLISCTAFQYLENAAYLSGKGVLGWTPQEQGRAYVVGSRWLAVYTGLEIGKLLAEIVAKRQGRGSDKVESEEEKAQMEAVRRSMVINLAWTPLTLHWATEGGFLSDFVIGLGGCIPGVIQMRKLWRETAK